MSSRKEVKLLSTVTLALLLLVANCHENEGLANHLLLFDSLPDGFSSQKTTPFDIRTNFSGSVQLVESRDFRVVVNITSPSLQQAYDVNADFYAYNGRVVLEIKEQRDGVSAVNLAWLFIGMAVATVFVGICTGVHAVKWYKQERQKFDFSDHKSYASSSQRGAVYRTGNMIPMSHLHPGASGDHLLRGDDADNIRNLRCDEELRQVPEMPEEEEAEALEMEQLSKLKLQGDTDLSAENEDSDPQERNLIKSRFHSQPKSVHKDLIKKANSGKRQVMYRRTQNGTYEGVPTDQEETSNDDGDLTEKEEKFSNETNKKTPFMMADLQVQLTGKSSEKQSNLSGNAEPAYANESPDSDPMLLVLADVHKSTPAKTEMISISKDKPSKVGNLYVTPSELKSVTMTTFGPGAASTPKSSGANSPSPRAEESNTANDIFDNIAKKYQTEAQWYPPGIAAMGDILEDPREDEQSLVSGSGQSASMYGSSEAFDVNDIGTTYYNLDSDLEVPPLDSDDILSDGGLPSPLGVPIYKSVEKGKVHDDIKLIPGALKSPGANTGRLVGAMKPRPYSSIIVMPRSVPDHANSSTDRDSQGSPPLPPPPEDNKSQPQAEGVFEFPPPPRFYKPPQHHVAWREKLQEEQGGVAGDYVHIHQDGTQEPNEDRPSRAGGGGGVQCLNPTYMNLTILSTLCVLTLASGVYSAVGREETRVDITVFAPRHFLTNATRVFFNMARDTEIFQPKDSSVLVYDVSEPLIKKDRELEEAICQDLSCDHHCDETKGACVCLKGYKLSEDGREGECVDVNECMEGKAKCDLAAGCYNRKGTYDCICGEDFYGNGKSCRECAQECPEKHYEVQPCEPEIQKICKACTQTCRSGYYMAEHCTSHENAICRVCQPECSQGEFEFRQCTNQHDRECKNSSLLLTPQASNNVILEEKHHIKEDSAKLDRLPAHYVGFTRYKLFRETGIYLELTVRFIDGAQRFLPVNQSMTPDQKILKSQTVERFCPNPQPDHYVLRYKKHGGLTFKQNDNGSIEACETHKQYGDFLPSLTDNNQSFICSQPGFLTNIFTVEDDFFLARTKWVDKSKRCQRNSRACETCTRKCRSDMFARDPICSVTADDSDNGISPKLMMCYNCCVKRNCSSECKDYHKRRCQPEQCSKGNLLEFTLEPSWDSSQDGRFFCHITPLQRQHLLELDYKVRAESSDESLHQNTIMIFGDKMWEKTGFLHYSDGILNITVNSSLGTMPNYLEGEISQPNSISVFKVGTYKSHGAELGTSVIRPDFVFIRPPKPQGIPPMPAAHQECTHAALGPMLLASNMDNPYIPDPRLEANANGSLPFVVVSKAQEPVVIATLSQATPILKQLYQPTPLNVKSFQGDVGHNGTHWVVTIKAESVQCPGYLHITLYDPKYPTETLFNCDVVIKCPVNFFIVFALPTSDKESTHKDIVVVVTDVKQVHHFRIYRKGIVDEGGSMRVRNDDVNAEADLLSTSGVKDGQGEEEALKINEISDLPLAHPYLIAIAGAITLLLVLAIIGLCFQPSLPVPDTPYAQWYHQIFAISYMMFQFCYSAIVSGTVFFLILTVVTSHHVNFVLNHGQSGAVSTASSHIALLQLQRHLEKEISRQDAQADVAQEVCIQDVQKIVGDLKKHHQLLLNLTEDVFARHRLDLLLSRQKLHVRERLAKDLENFRNIYAKAARSVLRQVNQNALASFQNVHYNNTWLDGARFLHEAVMLFMRDHKKEQKDFMSWTGIKGDLSKLEIDLTFSLPALPRLDDIPAPPLDKPQIKRHVPGEMPKKEPIRSIQMHNNWFFPLEESTMGGASRYHSVSTDEIRKAKNGTSVAFFIFLAIFIACDLILLAHRMCKAWTTAKLILFGFPEYFRERKEKENGDHYVFESKDNKNKLAPVHGCKDSPLCQSIKIFLTDTISTTFFPKIVGAIAACVFLICLLRFSNKYLTINELDRIGLYHSAEQYLDLQTSMTNARVQTHATYINSVDFPAFQSTMSGYISQHKTVLGMYRKHLTGLQNLNAKVYCQHLNALGIDGNCSDSTLETDDQAWSAIESISHACKFHPVIPRLFVRTSTAQNSVTERQVEALLESLRYIIYYTSQLTIIYLTIIVLKELICAVLWIFIQKSGVIRLRIIVEHDQDESAE